MSQERRLITVVFADIVGSTAASARHDPEVVRAERTRLFGRLRDILVEHGGTVEKFIGDAVMAVFGAPELHEDDAERAVRAALAMRQAVITLRPQLRLPVQLRIGVNSGEVVSDQPQSSGVGLGLVTGEAVVVGARLEQAADTDEILVGALTHRLTEKAVRFGGARTIDAKGIGPVTAWPVDAVVDDVPVHGRRLWTTGFLGRKAELQGLIDIYGWLAEGRPAQLVTLFGVAGVGKSRLVEEFLSHVSPAIVLRGRCLPYGSATGLWPFREILQAECGIEPTDPIEVASAKVRAAVVSASSEDDGETETVVKILDAVACARPVDATSDVAAELAWALRRYMKARARTGPVVVVIDDLQWSEPPVADAIEGLASRLRAPVLLLCISRPELLEARPGWGGGKLNAAAMEIGPLEPADVDRLISELDSTSEISTSMRVALAGRAGGNPLYVEEFVRTVAETGAVDVPPTLQGLISARLDHLPRNLKRLVQTASVVGEIFSLDDLQGLELADEDLDRVVEEALTKELVVEVAQRGLLGGHAYRFCHILVRDVAYNSIAKTERARLHDLFGRWVENASGARQQEYLGIVAHHAEQAYRAASEVGTAEETELGRRAFDALVGAARHADDHADRRTALGLYDRAEQVGAVINAPLLARSETLGKAALLRLDLSGGLGGAELDHALLYARAAGPSTTLLALLSEATQACLTDIHAVRKIGAEAVAAAQALGNPDLITQAMILGTSSYRVVLGDIEAELPELLAAVEFGRANGARVGLAPVVRALGNDLMRLGRFEEGAKLREEFLRLVGEPVSLVARYDLLIARAYSAYELGQFVTGASLLEAAVGLAEELGGRRLVRDSCRRLGANLFVTGELQRSRQVLLRSLENADPRDGWYEEACWRLARTELELGDVFNARIHAQTGVDLAQAQDLHASSNTRAILGSVYAASGDASTARRLFEEALAISADESPLDQVEVRIECARGLIRLGDARAACKLLERARAFFANSPAVGWRDYVEDLIRRCEGATAS